MCGTVGRSGKFVIPGEKIGVIEEFIRGKGTYVNNGVIRSKIVGTTLVNLVSREVMVYPRVRMPVFPEVGSTIIGQVVDVQKTIALVNILKIGDRASRGSFTGILLSTTVDGRRGIHVRDLKNAVRAGDIIVAKVLNNKNGIFILSTAGSKYGVIYALCSECGEILELEKTRLKCPKCKRVERRKTSSNYGKCVI